MIIYIDGKKAALKQNMSFDYVAENRLFLGRDGYSLNISFPLKDCQQNIDIFGPINRIDISKEKKVYECSIVDTNNSLFGSLVITKVSENDIDCQFAEGRCSQTLKDPFEETLITSLYLGSSPVLPPSGITPAEAWKPLRQSTIGAVALPWINEGAPTAPNNWVVYNNGQYSWHTENKTLSWQPYLIVITKRILDVLKYTYDFSEWENSRFANLIICNSLPGVWDMPEFAKVLPGWTVSEFFEKLELFLMCEFNFNHRDKHVVMRFSENALEEIEPVKITSLVDTYETEITNTDDNSCDYIASKRLAYKECSHEMQKFYACDWLVKSWGLVKKYDTLDHLIWANQRRSLAGHHLVEWGEQIDVPGTTRKTSSVGALLYAEDVDTYFVFRSLGTEYLGTENGQKQYTQVYILQPVNVFGSGSVEDDSVETEEIEFVPACVADTYVDNNDNMGFMLYLNPSSYSEETELPDDPQPTDKQQPSITKAIEAGQKEESSSYYSEIYVAFWHGVIPEPGRQPYPYIDNVIVTDDWKPIVKPGMSIRLSSHGSAAADTFTANLPKIQADKKFKFSWLADKIPDPRAIFHIKGRRYLCEKITATFTESGMSQLLKGEFYPLAES